MTEPGSWANRDENPLRPDSEESASEPIASESTASEMPDSVTPGAADPESEVDSSAEQVGGVSGFAGDAGSQNNSVSGNDGEAPQAQDTQNWAGSYPVSGFGAQAPQGAPGYATGQNMTPGAVPGYGLPPQSGQPGTPGYSGSQPGYAGYQGSGTQPQVGYAQPGYSVPGGYPGYGVLPSNAVSPKTKVAGALLAFFLGGLGAHNFYFGKKGKAIAQLALTLAGVAIFILGVILIGAGTDAHETSSYYGYSSYEDNDGMIAAGVVLLFSSFFILPAVGIWAFVEFILILSGTNSYSRDEEGRVIQ